jgi:hypothetical protein
MGQGTFCLFLTVCLNICSIGGCKVPQFENFLVKKVMSGNMLGTWVPLNLSIRDLNVFQITS